MGKAGLPVASKDGQKLSLHLFPASYFANLPDKEELLGMKREL